MLAENHAFGRPGTSILGRIEAIGIGRREPGRATGVRADWRWRPGRARLAPGHRVEAPAGSATVACAGCCVAKSLEALSREAGVEIYRLGRVAGAGHATGLELGLKARRTASPSR